ncbi:MAG: copper chaperone PCu(A)C, partial [Hylemonella sp.]|nr:copper chaperone PCu(A)C [Hylemonella sp.]
MKRTVFLLCMVVAGAAAAHDGDITVQDAWVRATVASQQGSAVFMKLRSQGGAVLIGVSTPLAKQAAIHEMRKIGDLMKMRLVPGGVVLPAGKTVEFKPSGYHIMLQGLEQALPEGSTVALTLVFKDRRGQTQTHVVVV